MRCVEAWSMVIPWLGFSLASLLRRVRADRDGEVRRVTTLVRPRADAGAARTCFEWPYVEGLRLDEAMHPLTLLAVGLYGKYAAEPERRSDPPGRAVEVRLQGHQVHRADPAHRSCSR